MSITAPKMFQDNPKSGNCGIEDIIVVPYYLTPVFSDELHLAAGEKKVG